MKKIIRKFKKANSFIRIFYILICLGYTVSFFFFAKSIISLTGIETIIRYLILLILLAYLIFYIIFNFGKIIRKKYVLTILTSLLSLIFIVIFSFSSYFIDLFYDKLSNFLEQDKINYTSYLITKSDKQLNSKSKLAMISDENDIEGYILAKEIIKQHKLTQKIVKYDDYLTMLYDLYDEKVDGVFISNNYITLYSNEEDFTNIASETKVLYQYSKLMKNTDKSLESDKSLSEPFTALIMGVDSETDGLNANAAFNGDTLILITFNPKTLSATMLSLPRDTYVPIACKKNYKYKINSAAAYGTSCVIETIENLTDINIDYYIKINFKGVVDLVEALDGVEVNVEKPNYQFNHGHDCKNYVCEQNSDRDFGRGTVYITPGLQKLNGEEALAYARNRGQYTDSDLARNRHQQDVIMAIAKKAIKINSYNKFKNVIDSISNNISVNMTTSKILSSYNIFKDMVGNMLNGEDFIGIQKAYLETYSLPVYRESNGMTMSCLGYYEDSLDEIIKAMKVNLELEKPTYIKSFTFDMNENYEAYVIGKGSRKSSTEKTVPSFIDKTKEDAEKYCEENKFNCTYTYIDETSEHYDEKIETDHIAAQIPHERSILTDNKLHFYITGKINNQKTKDNKLEDSTKKEEPINDKKDDEIKSTEEQPLELDIIDID